MNLSITFTINIQMNIEDDINNDYNYIQWRKTQIRLFLPRNETFYLSEKLLYFFEITYVITLNKTLSMSLKTNSESN